MTEPVLPPRPELVRLEITFRNGVQIRVDVSEYSTARSALGEPELREMRWTSPEEARQALHWLDVREVVSIVELRRRPMLKIEHHPPGISPESGHSIPPPPPSVLWCSYCGGKHRLEDCPEYHKPSRTTYEEEDNG